MLTKVTNIGPSTPGASLKTEQHGSFHERLPGTNAVKYVIFEQSVDRKHVKPGPKNISKFDFGPINTMISSNYVDGTRFIQRHDYRQLNPTGSSMDTGMRTQR